MLDLEWITAQLESRREALPIEIALHLSICGVKSAIHARNELGTLREIDLTDLVVDARGRVLLHARRGLTTEEELVRSLGIVLFSLLTGERPRDRLSTPLGLLAEEGVSESIIRIVARAVARTLGSRYRRLEELLFDLERWMEIHQMQVSPKTLTELLRRNRLLEHASPIQIRPRENSGQWFRASL